MRRSIVQVASFVLLWGSSAGGGGEESSTALPLPGSDKRRIYLLHSGVNTILAGSNKNLFAENMREHLLKRGIADRDIVVLENPYPAARWYNMFPHECVTMFMASAKPDSRVAQDA